MQIVIVGGSGRFGQWYAGLLARAGHAVTITGRNRAKLEVAGRAAGVAWATGDAAVTDADVVVVAASLPSVSRLIGEAARVAAPGALVCDLASVKEEVAGAYARITRQDLELASLHPLHGPRTPNLRGVTVLTMPLRTGPRYEALLAVLKDEGALLVETTAERHDADMAVLQGLTHFVAVAAGRSLADCVRPSYQTPAFTLLQKTVARVVLQDPVLYAAIQRENPANRPVREAFVRTASRLAALCDSGDDQALEREIQVAARAFGDPEAELRATDLCLAALAGPTRPSATVARPGRRVAVLGPPGTFSEVAFASYQERCGETLAATFLRTIADVFDAVRRGEAELGIVPVENMIEGTIAVTLDRLFETGLRVQAEVLVTIHQALAALPGARLEQVQRVLSIPPALGQCRAWLAAHVPGAKLVEASSTAEAIDQVARLRYEGDAAIGLATTAEAAGLEVLARDIEDEQGNVTRFFVIGTTDAPRTGRDRSSLCVHDVPNRPGILEHVLQVLAQRGLNLSKIESRPTRRKLGEYQFYIDVEGHRDDASLRDALADLGAECRVTLLGSYPRGF